MFFGCISYKKHRLKQEIKERSEHKVALKSSKEFLELALTNNSFDSDTTDRILRSSLEKSFSSLYRLQRALIGYEEYFYTTRNNPNQQDYGDFFLEKYERVCMNVPSDLVGHAFREKYRNSEYDEERISYETLKKEQSLFSKMPVLTIDNQVVHNFDLEIHDDFFTIVLPNHKEFLYTKHFDPNLNNYRWISHEVCVQIIPNDCMFEITTSQAMLMRNSYSGNNLDRVRLDYIKDLGGSFNSRHEGTYFAVIYKKDENFGSPLQDVVFDSDGNPVILYDEDVRNSIKNYIGELTIQFIFYQHLYSYESFRYDGVNTLTKCPKVKDYNDGITSDLMVVRKKDGTDYEMGIPTENFMLFRNVQSENSSGYEKRVQIPNTGLVVRYPNIYRLISGAEGGESIRVYFFYSPDYKNLSYTNLYGFIFKYFEHRWKDASLEETINNMYFGDIIKSKDPLVNIQNTTCAYFQAKQLNELGLIRDDQVQIFYNFALKDANLGRNIEYVKQLFLQNIDRYTENYYNELTREDITIDEINAMQVPPEVVDFTNIFSFAVDHEIVDYRYDEIDYLQNYQKTTPPLNYKIMKLKEFISDNVNILRDYVLEQKKVGIKYEFTAEECNLSQRIRYEKEGNGEKLIEPMYLFAIAKPDPYQDLSARIFINGLLCTEFVYDRYEYMDYIYIPVDSIAMYTPEDRDVNNPYFEIEVYPAMEYEDVVTFTKEKNTIILDYSKEDDIIPTLSDILMYLGTDYTLEKLPKEDFTFRFISDRYNYYTDLSKPVKLYKKFVNGKIVDGEYYDEEGHYYTYEGQNVPSKNITIDELNKKVYDGDLEETTGLLTSNRMTITPDKNEITYHDVVFDDATLVHPENTGVIFSNVSMIEVTCNNPDYYGKEITVRIAKHPYYFTHNANKIAFPRVNLNLQNTQNCEDYVRVYKNGRMICRNRYEYREINGYMAIRPMEVIGKGESFTVDVSPYRSRLLWYKDCIVDDVDNIDFDDIRVDLRGKITKPFDPRYYEIYLNGRRLAQRQITVISPWEIKLSDCHSVYNLELYEKDRDWEYYGVKDFNSYFTLSDLIRKDFVKGDKEIIKKLIHDVTGDLPTNDNCEDRENWNKMNDSISIEFLIFYYNELIPLVLAKPEENQFNKEYIAYTYPKIHELFYKLNDKGESVYLLNPDLYYEPDDVKEENKRWLVYMTGNGPLEDIE